MDFIDFLDFYYVNVHSEMIFSYCVELDWQNNHTCMGVIPGDAGGAMAPPDFVRSVNPISIRGGRLCPPNNTDTPGFSDLPMALCRALTFY